jgi:2-keto-4-pentenoate hydratase/2-oxohepta-3-ene-1,7-dioic acid hydratase in catechol pathway
VIGYKLATLQTSNGSRAAAIIGDVAYEAVNLTGDARYVSVQNILEDWDRAHAKLEVASGNPNCTGVAVAAAKFLAPIPKPNVVYCAGANYRDHAEEMANLAGKPPKDPRADGAKPWFFLKSPHTVVAPDAIVHVTQYGHHIDWEAELVVIIGRKVRNVPVQSALDFVAGYTCGNDLSARDQGFRLTLPESSPFRADWTRHKSFDDACPMGPWMVPAPYVSDPTDLPIRLWVNADLKQNSNSGNMIFSAAEQISYLSESITLYPGDVIMTGTPAGVGASKRSFLKSGDVVRLEIGEIGMIRNVVK